MNKFDKSSSVIINMIKLLKMLKITFYIFQTKMFKFPQVQMLNQPVLSKIGCWRYLLTVHVINSERNNLLGSNNALSLYEYLMPLLA